MPAALAISPASFSAIWKYFPLLAVSIVLDVCKALLCAAIEGLFAAFSGTIAGYAAGCALGGNLFGSIGCKLVGLAGAAVGTTANGPAAALGVPLGFIFANVIAFGIDATFGIGFLLFLSYLGLFPMNRLFTWRRMPLVLSTLIPGFDMLPFQYTAITVMGIMEKEVAPVSLVSGYLSGLQEAITPLRNTNTWQRQSEAVRERWTDTVSEELQSDEGHAWLAQRGVTPQMADIRLHNQLKPRAGANTGGTISVQNDAPHSDSV